MSRPHSSIVSILVLGLIFSFGILSALNVLSLKNISKITYNTQLLQEDLTHEISLTQQCIEKINNKREEDLIKKFINTSNYSIVGVDFSGKIIAWSKGSVNIFGYSKIEIIGQSLHVLIPDTLREDHRNNFSAKMNDPLSTNTDIFERYLSCQAIKADGTMIDVEVTVIGLPNGLSVGTIELKEQ